MKVGDMIAQYFELSRMTAKRHRAGFGIILGITEISCSSSVEPNVGYLPSKKRYEVLWPDGVISMIDECDALSYEEYMGSQAIRWMNDEAG